MRTRMRTLVSLRVDVERISRIEHRDDTPLRWFRRRPTAKGVGLRVADSHTGNHPEDDFTPLETIRRLYSVFGRRSYLGFEGETSEPKGREYFFVLPKYRVILPTSTQTILDAPPRYIGLYTHFFSLANLKLPLNDFFCEAYDCEPCVELFLGFFNLCKAGSWLTFQTISEKHIPSLLAKVITRIEVAYAFEIPLLFLAVFMGTWPIATCNLCGRQGNFIYTEDDEDLTFLPKDFSPGFNIGSPSVSINTEPVRTDEEPAVEPTIEPATDPVNERVGTTTDLGGNPKGDTFVVHAGSVAARIRERKCKIMGGSSRPRVKRKLAFGSSTLRTIRAKASSMKDDTPVLSISDDDEGLEYCLELKDASVCHLKISAITPPTWKGFLDNHPDVDLLDLHDRCYARQAVVDNAVNRRSRKLLKVIEKLSGEADVMRARELAREEECEGLRAKCEAAMTDFDKNPAVSLLALESKVSYLEAEKANLKATEASLRQEIEEVKHDRREVVSKVVPYACMKLLLSDELGRLVGKLVSSAITFGRCRAYEQVARMKDPFDLSKVKGCRPSYEKEHTQASNDLATATFSWSNEYVADASASVEALLSKKALTLQKPIPSRTQMLVPSSQLATPSSAPSLKPMSPPANIVKPSPFLNE
ncbi:hypothetical protein Tco_0359420 [Tanacetum coccineum]